MKKIFLYPLYLYILIFITTGCSGNDDEVGANMIGAIEICSKGSANEQFSSNRVEYTIPFANTYVYSKPFLSTDPGLYDDVHQLLAVDSDGEKFKSAYLFGPEVIANGVEFATVGANRVLATVTLYNPVLVGTPNLPDGTYTHEAGVVGEGVPGVEFLINCDLNENGVLDSGETFKNVPYQENADVNITVVITDIGNGKKKIVIDGRVRSTTELNDDNAWRRFRFEAELIIEEAI